MRTIAIGDIHGCSTALDTLLAQVRPQPEDCFILLGDVVDRGPNSRGVMEMVLALREQTQLVVLRGNHEEMMQQARDNILQFSMWFAVGGRETLASYQWEGEEGDQSWVDAVPLRHWEFLDQGLKDWHETAECIFVHASLRPDLPLADQPGEVLRWEMFPEEQVPHQSGKIMVCGHTAQKNGLPLCRPQGVCIDTWVYGRGWLTALDVGTGQIWQANQRGDDRTMTLSECA